MKKKQIVIGGVLAAVVALALGAAAIAKTGPFSTGAATVLPSATCGLVYYQGSGKPNFIIASDLPLQGAGRIQNLAMGQAVRFVLNFQYHFKAGKYKIGYQECDDSTAQRGAYDPAVCSSNARAYASDRSVVGILGTFNSGCSKLMIPILNRAPGGAVAMISSANTAVGLTHYAPWNNPGEPGIYYPTGKRNYVRVAASDDFQGPAAADLLQKLRHVKSVYILNDNTTFGTGVGLAFQSRAEKIGIKVLGNEPWSATATDYTALAQHIKDSGAEAVYLAGIVCNNGVKLLKDLRSVVGPGPVFAGPDGWTPYSATLGAGSAAQGMYVSYAGLPLETINKSPAGRKFIKDFSKFLGFYYVPRGQLPPPYSVYQAQAAQIMLDAIARSNGTRASVTSELFKTNVKNGIMGSFHFDKNGDIVPTKAISFDQLKGDTGVYVYVVITKVKG